MPRVMNQKKIVEVAADDLIREDVPEPERCHQRYHPACC